MAVDTEIAPTGKFRVGMNANNATLVIRSADGTVSGLSADLGRFIAGKLGVTYEPVVYDSAAPFTASFGKSEWHIILTGKNAVVAKLVDFSADLFLIEYLCGGHAERTLGGGAESTHANGQRGEGSGYRAESARASGRQGSADPAVVCSGGSSVR